MKRRYLFTCLLFACFVFSVLAKEPLRQERAGEPFKTISVSSGIDLYVRVNGISKIEVEAEKSHLHRITTEVVGDQLQIHTEKGFRWGLKDVHKVFVSVKELRRITSSGGADVYSEGVLRCQNLKLSASGGSDMYVDVETDELILESRSGADLKISGTTRSLRAIASGGSDINAKDLIAESVSVKTFGGSDAVVNVTKRLTAEAMGTSDIIYYGNPADENLKESGGGEIVGR